MRIPKTRPPKIGSRSWVVIDGVAIRKRDVKRLSASELLALVAETRKSFRLIHYSVWVEVSTLPEESNDRT